MSVATVLIIESEGRSRQILRSALHQEGYVTFASSWGSAVSRLLQKQALDLIVLDWNSRKEDVTRLCRAVRLTFDGPLVVLSTSDLERDKVLAFDAGADDYLVKPYGRQELLARLRALLRRCGHQQPHIVDTPDLGVDLEGRLVVVRGKKIYLGPKEFEVLKVLVLGKGKPVSFENLFQAVWGRKTNRPEVVRVVIHELRRKIERRSSKPQYIRTEPRIGYRFTFPVGMSKNPFRSRSLKS